MEKLVEKASLYIDVNGLITRKEVIEKIISTDSFYLNVIFNDMTNEEKEEYYTYLTQRELIKYINTCDINTIIRIVNKKIDEVSDTSLTTICNTLNSVKEKEIFIDKFYLYLSSYSTYVIICGLSSDIDKERFINKYVVDKYYYMLCIKTLSDEVKIKYIDRFTKISDRAKLIVSFKNKELIKKYALMPEYSNYRSTLVVSTMDSEFIIEMFRKIEIPSFRNNIINKVNDSHLKLELIRLLKDDGVKGFLLSNYIEVEENIELSKTEVDENITFGVELECSNKDIKQYENLKTIFNDYRIKKDTSVKSGFEIVSPVLHYNIKDLSKLKKVCELLKENNFYTDYTSGGHIHVGAKYLTRRIDYNMLLYLYINTEDILYFISDRENSIKRKKVKEYACKNKERYIKAVDAGLFSLNDERPIIDIFNLINTDRYKGLNFKNLGSKVKDTIEFRMPNGEIEFDELMLNIKLFTRLIEVSHNINDLSDNDEIKVKTLSLCEIDSEKERLDVLLDILFTNEEEKEPYRKRYYANKKLYLKNIRNLLDDVLTNMSSGVRIEEESKSLIRNVN